MGVPEPDSTVFLSEKDNSRCNMAFVTVRPTLEIIENSRATSRLPGDHSVCRSSQVQEQRSREEQEEGDLLCKISAPVSEFTKVPSLLMEQDFKNRHVHEDDEGFKTPTSSDHKIPAILQCPRAPSKRRPAPSTKPVARPIGLCPRLIPDASINMESLFSPRNLVTQRSVESKKLKQRDQPERFTLDASIEIESLFTPRRPVNRSSAETTPRKLRKKTKLNEG